MPARAYLHMQQHRKRQRDSSNSHHEHLFLKVSSMVASNMCAGGSTGRGGGCRSTSLGQSQQEAGGLKTGYRDAGAGGPGYCRWGCSTCR